MNVGNIENQSYTAQILSNTLQTPASHQPQQLNTENVQQNLMESVQKSGQTIAISQLSKDINNLHSELGKTGNADDVQQAREALRQTVVQFARTPNNEQMLNFVRSTREYSEAFGSGELQKAFKAAFNASQEGVNLKDWWGTFSSINDNSLRKDFVNVTENINRVEAPSSMKQKTINKLLSTINELNNALPENERNQAISELFNELKTTQNLNQMNQTMETLKEESLGEQGLI